MRTKTLILSLVIAATASMAAYPASAQINRPEDVPGSSPIPGYSAQQRTYIRGYVQRQVIPSVDYSGQLAVGGMVPSSYTFRAIDGDPAIIGYRYGRFNNKYIVVDQAGRVIDVIE
jgi:hypothetical protein